MLPPAVATGGRESTDRPGATPAPRLLNATRWPPGRLAGRTPTLRFQTLFEHLRLPLVVVQRGPGRRQTLHAAGLEAALLEPVRGAGGEHEQGLQAQGAGALLDAFEQCIATLAVAIVRMHGQAGQLAPIRVGHRIKRRTGDDQTVALHHAELLHLALQHLPRAAHQDALLLQRADKLQQTAHVGDGRLAQRLELLLIDQGAAAVAGEQLVEQRAVLHVADHVAALHTTATGAGGRLQQAGLVAVAEARQMLADLLRTQLADQPALLVQQPLLGTEQQQLVGAQFDGGAGGHVLAGQVEDLPGGRVAQRGEQHDAALVQLAADALAVDAAHLAGVVVVHPVHHADGPRGDEVAAGDAQARALHGRGGHVHGQTRLDGDAQLTDGVDHAFQGRLVGDAQALVEARLQAALGQPRLDLRTRAVHQHQAHPQAVQQHQVVDDVAEVDMFDGVPRQHDHEGTLAVRVDVGRGIAKPADVVVHEAGPVEWGVIRWTVAGSSARSAGAAAARSARCAPGPGTRPAGGHRRCRRGRAPGSDNRAAEDTAPRWRTPSLRQYAR